MKILRNIILLLVTIIIISSCATAEVRAVRKGDLQGLEKFLSKGGDPNTVDADGNPLIHVAVQYGQISSLERLLSAGADPNLLNSTRNTAAILAAGMNRLDLLSMLKDFNADMKIAGNQGKTTLMLAAANGNIQMMEKLLRAFVPINGEDRSGASALFYSVSSSNSEAMSYLLSSGADALHIDNNGRNALHLLKENKHLPYARLLVDAGTDPSMQQDSTRETPLHIASGSGAWELVEYYLSNGAVNVINLSSTNLGAPLFYSLKPAISSSSAVKTMRILLSSGADPNEASVKEILPIVFAIENLDIPRIEMLIKNGANLNIRISERRTLLHLAVSRDNPELVSILIDAGINPDLKDLEGNTALFIAEEKASLKTMEILLIKRADPNIANNSENTVLLKSLKKDAANSQGLSDMTNLLLRYGATLPADRDILAQLLKISVESGNTDVAQLLLRAEANPNILDNKGISLLQRSLEKDAVNSQGLSEMTNLLLRYRAALPPGREVLSQLLKITAESGNAEVAHLLLVSGANPNETSTRGMTMLMLASKGKFIKLSEVLLEQGARANMRDQAGNTAMHYSSQAGFVEGVKLLLQYGENPDPVNYEQIRPIQLAPKNEQGQRIVVMLLTAGAKPVQEETPAEETTQEETPAEETTQEETPAEETAQVEDGDMEDSEPAAIDEEKWNKARVLVLGEDEPRGISGARINFPGFTALVPQSYPRNLTSKSNPKEVDIYIRNETSDSVEIYQVKADRNIEEVSVLLSGEITVINTRQGNVFPIYSGDSLYFGEIQTTGKDEQYFRLVQDD